MPHDSHRWQRLRLIMSCGISRILAGLIVFAIGAEGAAGAVELVVAQQGAALRGTPLYVEIGVTGVPPGQEEEVVVLLDGRAVQELTLGDGQHQVKVEGLELPAREHRLAVQAGGTRSQILVTPLPGWLSVLPPLLAIGLALISRDVLISLFLGVFSGALFLNGWNPFAALGRSIDQFIVPALSDPDHAAIIVFTALLGGMVGIISKCGGTQGIVEKLAVYATSSRRGQLATWLMGLFIFFDDYANTLIVGSTMRPITDRLRISREKLAYIVDATAAPVASVFPISTWIGMEVGLIAGAFSQLDLPYDAYTTFLRSIPYRFYPILALVLGFSIAASRRDFGPMLRAERRAHASGKVLADGDVPLADYTGSVLAPPGEIPKRAINALLPVLAVIVVTVLGLYRTGADALDRSQYSDTFIWLRDVFSHADSYRSLLWASLTGVVVALVLVLGQRLLTVRETTSALADGIRSMLLALVVLLLAWALGSACGELHTADYVVLLTRDILSPHWLPVLTFVLSAAISFATGTSWGTMAILMPLVIPICNSLALAANHPVSSDSYYVFMLGTISSVLAGSVWGDHCSPISDTTILSSMASGCDHIAHVKTQVPYALAAGILGMLLGDIPSAFGLSPFVSLLLGGVAIVALVRWLGKTSATPSE